MNMIIDAHTHIYPDAVAEVAIKTIIDNTKGRLKAYIDGTYNDLLRSMDEAGVDISIVLPVATRPGHAAGILQWVKEIMHRSSRLIFFGSLHPLDNNYKDIISEIRDAGLQGIKFHPAYQDFPADAPEACRVYEEILKNGLVIYFHSGVDMSLPHSDYTAVERFANVLQSFSGEKMIMAHAGGDCEWERVVEHLGGKKCYFDIAFVLENMKMSDLAREFYRQNEDYFVFGTDTPWREQKHYVRLIQDSVSLTAEQKEKMFHKNIQKLIHV